MGAKTFAFTSKNWDLLPKYDQTWPKIGIFSHFGLGLASAFGALLVGWWLVARGLYLARHLFTLYIYCETKLKQMSFLYMINDHIMKYFLFW